MMENIVDVSSALADLIAAGPDPEGAAPRLERFVESGGALPSANDGDGRALLVALLSNGGYLANLVLSDPDALPRLRADPYLHRSKPRASLVAELLAATAPARDFADLQRRLRQITRREMLRLGAREIGWGTTMEVAAELSFLADACLEAAVGFCEAELRAAYGTPQSADGPPGFVVLGMGKLGGEELNFSSDVDLVYVYSSDDGRAGSLTLHEYYVRLSQAVTRALDEITADGLVFRVDLRLRPEGRGGAICNSLPACERYYEAFGRTWERQALLRARPCAGDAPLGALLLQTLAPFIHPRSLGAGAVEQVRELRRLFTPTGQRALLNVKLGTGGIRDVELTAQLLQLLHAGKRPELRERATLPALHKLWVVGLLTDHEERSLAAAYRFLRRVEHRLQLEDGAQTHELPAEPTAIERLARRLGFPDGEAFARVLNEHRITVAAIAETLGEPEQAPAAIVLRLLDPASSREQSLADLASAGFRDVEAAADSLDLARARLPSEWLEESLASPDPDRALGHFRDLALHGSLGLRTLLRDTPQLLRMLATLFGTSERLSRHLIGHPALWLPLAERFGAPALPDEAFGHALTARLAGLDEEEALREMRRFAAEEILRIGLHDVSGTLPADEASRQLGTLAEAILAATVDRVLVTLRQRHGIPAAALTILALGSLGAREMRYGSDLDLVFLYAGPGTTTTGMDHQEWFARLAQRVINALGALLDEGRLYEVDTRLRPSGEQGMLVTTYASFARYHREDAAAWERMALLRARPVYAAPGPTGDAAAGFAATLIEIAYGHATDDATVASELYRIRRRIEDDRARDEPGTIHLRFSPGGLTDLEFLAALGQLRHGRDDQALRTTSPLAALRRLIDRGGGAVEPALVDDYRFLQRASLRLRLLRDRPDDRLLPEDRALLARTLDMTTAQFSAETETRMARVRTAFMTAFGQQMAKESG